MLFHPQFSKKYFLYKPGILMNSYTNRDLFGLFFRLKLSFHVVLLEDFKMKKYLFLFLVSFSIVPVYSSAEDFLEKYIN